MAVGPIESADSGFALQVERLYACLIQAVDSSTASDCGLGGKLLYAGELDAQARALMVAANIAGAASLAASADAAVGKQAIRDGVGDFLVTSLDEALRILKNEIRKRETVSVCVALAPDTMQCEMLERGVLPDLVRHVAAGLPVRVPFVSQGARPIEPAALEGGQVLLAWRVASSPFIWLPKLDAIALECLNEDSNPAAGAARRWLRLAPRYLGRLAQGVRVLRCREQTAQRFQVSLQERVERGEIPVSVEVQFCSPPTASIRLQSSFTP